MHCNVIARKVISEPDPKAPEGPVPGASRKTKIVLPPPPASTQAQAPQTNLNNPVTTTPAASEQGAEKTICGSSTGFSGFAQIIKCIKEISESINIQKLVNFFREAAECMKLYDQELDKALFFIYLLYFFWEGEGDFIRVKCYFFSLYLYHIFE